MMRKLTLRPGVNTQISATLNEAGIENSQLIRFPFGLPEKQGGWQAYPNLPRLIGTCRGLFGWADFQGRTYIAAGTEQRLQVMAGGTMADLTPLRQTTNPTPSYSTTGGSNVVQITDTGHGTAVGDWVYLVDAVSVGGLILQFFYQVQSVVDGNNYTINAASNATATVANGGAVALFNTTSGIATVTVTLNNHGLAVNQPQAIAIPTTVGGIALSGTYTVVTVPNANTFTITATAVATSTASASENGGHSQIRYLIPTGYAVVTAVSGWGVGAFGMGLWGTGSSGTITVPARQWSLFNFGQDLIASPTNGAIYYWAPPNPQPLTTVAASPSQSTVVFGMGQAQIIIACGAEASGTQYPCLIRWCDSGDFTAWVASVSNQAGSYQVPTGSTIIAGLAIGLGALIWTDVDLWSMQYSGTPFVFSFNRVGVACDPLGPKSVAVLPGNIVAWPGTHGFFRFDGGTVSSLPCTVWDTFYKQLDRTRQTTTCAALNALFSEVAWFFARLDGQTGYVRWNYSNNLWDMGILDRTAWAEVSPANYPIATSSSGVIYQHEITNDADGQPLSWSFTTGYFDLQDGEDFTFVDQILPDFVGNYTAVQFTMLSQDRPNGTVQTYGPYTLGPTVEYVNVRVRDRQIAFRFAGNDLGSQVRLGGVRYRFSDAGRKR